ncbi:hypothetical protein ACFL2A_04755 [Thermodesulfobacteriota bacterium]
MKTIIRTVLFIVALTFAVSACSPRRILRGPVSPKRGANELHRELKHDIGL